jgi:hypothetical protein
MRGRKEEINKKLVRVDCCCYCVHKAQQIERGDQKLEIIKAPTAADDAGCLPFHNDAITL